MPGFEPSPELALPISLHFSAAMRSRNAVIGLDTRAFPRATCSICCHSDSLCMIRKALNAALMCLIIGTQLAIANPSIEKLHPIVKPLLFVPLDPTALTFALYFQENRSAGRASQSPDIFDGPGEQLPLLDSNSNLCKAVTSILD